MASRYNKLYATSWLVRVRHFVRSGRLADQFAGDNSATGADEIDNADQGGPPMPGQIGLKLIVRLPNVRVLHFDGGRSFRPGEAMFKFIDLDSGRTPVGG